jgi:D-xylose transport system ATP-binding protein
LPVPCSNLLCKVLQVAQPILQLEQVTKQFPGVKALDQVSFAVNQAEVHGICGENGAGKSTLMKIIAGVYPYGSYEGKMAYHGEELRFAHDSINQAMAKGIALVHQELALIPQLTVGENIYLGREPARAGIINWHKLYAETQKTLARYNLDLPFATKVGNLSVGKQQMVEIARALAEDAQVLILDEPTSALTDAEVATLMEILSNLRDQGKTCLYISHKLEELFEITDQVTVIRDGRVVGTLQTEKTNSEEIIAMMVGREMTERFPSGNRDPNGILLEVEGLSSSDPDQGNKQVVKDVSFDLRKGEILGVAGLMGSGRSELVTSLFGVYGKYTTGTIRIMGEELSITSPREAMNHGFSLIPEDRKRMGLIAGQSILKNISLPNLERFAGFASIKKHLELNQCENIAKELAVKTPTLSALVNSLSGGNQQKVVLAKWLLSSPKVLILDEPTRGIDVGAKYEIYKLINHLAEEGVSIIMVSSELPEVVSMSDRILVMHEGKLAGILDHQEATQEKIMALATGMTPNGED